MADEVKKRRGRPKKSPPVVNEEKKVLEMTYKPDKEISVEDIKKSLTALYDRMLGTSDQTARWNPVQVVPYNPFLQNQRLKYLNSVPNQMNPEELAEAVTNPGSSEVGLRQEGWSLSGSQYLYYKILRLASDIPKFKYYKIPELVKNEEYTKDAFVNEDNFVDEWLRKLDVANTFKRMSLEVKREGKPSYLIRNSIDVESDPKKVNYVAFQKLPTEYVKLTGIGEHGYIASLNMMMFMNPMFKLSEYPDYIQDIWELLNTSGALYKNDKDGYDVNIDILNDFKFQVKYRGEFINGQGDVVVSTKGRVKTYAYWIELPQDLCFTFCSDSSNAWAVPDTTGLFLGLKELTDYDTLAGLIQSTPLTAILTAEAEVVNNPNPGANQTVLSPETIAGFQDKFNDSTSTNLEAFFAPLKNFKLLSLPNIPNASDIKSSATKDFVTRATLSGLFSITDKPSVAQIKAAQLIEEAATDFVTLQFQSVVNFIINELIGCTYKWQVFLWGKIFTFADELKRDKELFVSGATFVLPKIASAYDLTLRDVKAVSGYINSMKIYDDFKTITQVQQQQIQKAAQVETGEVKKQGRPAIDDNDIDNDNTAASKESGLDTSETREFTWDGKCIICGAESDTPICEECAAEYGIDLEGGESNE